MIFDCRAGTFLVALKARIEDALVLGINITIFAGQRDRQVPVALALRIKHCA